MNFIGNNQKESQMEGPIVLVVLEEWEPTMLHLYVIV